MNALTPATPTVDKRPMGSGTIEPRNGKFRVRLRVAGKRRDLGTYPDRATAEGVLQAALDQLEAQSVSPASAITLRSFGKEWFEAREVSGAVRSVDNELSRWHAHVESAPFIDDPIDRIERRAIRKHIHSLLGKRAVVHIGNGKVRPLDRKLNRNTVSQVLSILRNCFAAALADELIDVNPAEGIKLPKALRTQDPWTYLTLDEIERLLSCEKIPEPIRLIYAAAIYTGLRKGELWGLRWGDVYLTEQPYLMVRRSHKSAPKNGKAGWTPLIPRAVAVFERVRELADDTGPEALVFPLPDGSQRARGDDAFWRSRTLSRRAPDGSRIRVALPGYAKRAGITRHVRFHDLRHTCASQLVSGGWGKAWPLERVSAFLRHSSPAQTARYAHLAPEAIHADAAATRGPWSAPGVAIPPENSGVASLRSDGTERSHSTHLPPFGAALGPAIALLRSAAGDPAVSAETVAAFLAAVGAEPAAIALDQRLLRRVAELAADVVAVAAGADAAPRSGVA